MVKPKVERKSRQTRSVAAPDWSQQECITLVNELNAVESEWQHTLASFQIWQLVVENCNALHVPNNRSLNQCKQKWESLLADFNKVDSYRGSYWSFDSNKRKDLSLPEHFDLHLFTAIDAYLNRKGTTVDDDDDEESAGPDTDPEPNPDIQGTTASWGPKKKRRKITPRARKSDDKFRQWGASTVCKRKSKSSGVADPPIKNIFAEVILDHEIEEDKEEKLTAQISEKVELMNAILQGNADVDDDDFDCKLSDLRNVEAMRIDTTRRRGNKLIDCLGTIVNTLNQLCDHVQTCK